MFFMSFHKTIDFNNLQGCHTFIYGETNTKKTYCTAQFVRFLIELKGITPKDITILDFAPDLVKTKKMKIGGKIQDYYENSTKCRNISFR